MGKSAENSSEDKYILLIIAISLASFMSSLDGTIVNIALPSISEAFDLSSSSVSWVATSYLLVMAGCVLIFGKISDIIGFKKVFLTGFVVFTAGSFACGFLPDFFNSFYLLIGSRIFQGAGGAMITAIAPAMVAAYISSEKKGKAMGIIMTVAALGMAIGPTVGGFLTQYLSWHWIFFINVPVGIAAVILGAGVIPSSSSKRKESLKGFDKYGAALIFTGLAALLFAVSEGQSLGWTSPEIILFFAIAFIAICGFVCNEMRAKDPLLEIRLFKDLNFVNLNLIIALLFLGFAGVNYLMPFYLQYVLGYDTSAAGLILTSLSFAMMVSGIIAGILFNRTGGKLLCIAAALIITAGYFMMTHLHTDTGALFVIACLVLIGLGLGLMVTPGMNMILNMADKKYHGMVSGLTSLERFAPMTIGIAIFNFIFIEGILKVASYRGVTMQAPANIKLEVLAAGFDLAFLGSFIVGVIILVLAFLIKNEKISGSN